MKVKREVWTVLIVLISLISVNLVLGDGNAGALAGGDTQTGQTAIGAASTEITAPPTTAQAVTSTSSQVLYRYDGSAIQGLASSTPSVNSNSRISQQVFGYYYNNVRESGADGIGSTVHIVPGAYTRLRDGYRTNPSNPSDTTTSRVVYLTSGQNQLLQEYFSHNNIVYIPQEVRRESDQTRPIAGGTGARGTTLSTTTATYVRSANGQWVLNSYINPINGRTVTVQGSQDYTTELNTVIQPPTPTGTYVPLPAILAIPGPVSSAIQPSAGQNQNFEPSSSCPITQSTQSPAQG